jgi:hypothetical protein
MSKTLGVHIVKRGSVWAVEQGGRVLSSHRTQATAESAGRPVAKREETELVTHRPNGNIRDSDSYGGDPNPPKDKKH